MARKNALKGGRYATGFLSKGKNIYPTWRALPGWQALTLSSEEVGKQREGVYSHPDLSEE
jgi:hypothetical protein